MASDKWKDVFNNTGDAAACAEAYEADIVMQARPMGTITGTAEI